jgi:hypothetical protein
LLAAVSSCRNLRVLALQEMLMEPRFPPGTAFGRLTHLEMWDRSDDERKPDPGTVGLWELMASGAMPALAKLRVRARARWGATEVRTRLLPAFEAVAGTLTHLDLVPWHHKWLDDLSPMDEEALHELGAAMGKLRRLKDLALDLSDDGRAYHALAQGLAASGGGRPLPLLWRVTVIPIIEQNADLLASLVVVLPSVEVFVSSEDAEIRELLLTACALRQAGYKHVWALVLEEERGEECSYADIVREIPLCKFGKTNVHTRFSDVEQKPLWIV